MFFGFFSRQRENISLINRFLSSKPKSRFRIFLSVWKCVMPVCCLSCLIWTELKAEIIFKIAFLLEFNRNTNITPYTQTENNNVIGGKWLAWPFFVRNSEWLPKYPSQNKDGTSFKIVHHGRILPQGSLYKYRKMSLKQKTCFF